MGSSGTAEDDLLMSTGRDEPRNPQPPSWFTTDRPLALTTAIFCIGLVSGAAGGLLLGATAVVVLQSLELLDKNKLLMDQLLNYMIVEGSHVGADTKECISQSPCSDQNRNFGLFLLVGVFGIVSSVLSLAVGIFLGLSAYSRVIKKYGEEAMGKALSVAGPVCLMGVTASGYTLGLGLESFLSVASSFREGTWFLILILSLLFLVTHIIYFSFLIYARKFTMSWLSALTVWILTPGSVIFLIILIIKFFKTKMVLFIALIPMIWAVSYLKEDCYLTPVALMLIIAETFNSGEKPIVTLHSPTSTNTISSVHEGIFIGLFTSQLFTAAIGTSLFVSCHRGGAAKICAGAAGSGLAVLIAVKGGLLVLGPGPTVGALLGLAGAVGVSLAAATAVTDNCGQVVGRCSLVGRLGVTVGAAAGACVISRPYSGLSWTFVGLCTAAIPAALSLKQMVLFLYIQRGPNFKRFLCLIIVVIILGWCNFVCPVDLISYRSVIHLLCVCIMLDSFTKWAVDITK